MYLAISHLKLSARWSFSVYEHGYAKIAGVEPMHVIPDSEPAIRAHMPCLLQLLLNALGAVLYLLPLILLVELPLAGIGVEVQRPGIQPRTDMALVCPQFRAENIEHLTAGLALFVPTICRRSVHPWYLHVCIVLLG